MAEAPPPLPAAPPPGLAWAFLSFRGRLGRRAYFLGSLLPLLAFGLATFGLLSETGYADEANVETTAGTAFALLAFAVMVVSPWLYAALTVKRLHDLDMSAYLIVFVFVPVVALPAFAFLCLIEGTDGPNDHGPRRNSRPGDR